MLTPGTILQHYRIRSKIGEGAMGVVYEGQDTRLQRPVAIKVLPVDRITDPIRKGRFVQEAKAASALNHPNIITIHDVGSADGVDYIVMEYIQGKTLEQLIRPSGISPSLVTRYGVQIADALAKAHAAGILHRDLKPSNIMVTDDGRIKILDFGVAKLLDTPNSPFADTATTLALTEEGMVVGTTAYMSPEQAEGRQVDPRSDIFSFGSILYELVTGRRPFTGDSRLAVLTKILSQDPQSASTLVPSISPDLDKVILRCLRKDPARRYQTMADLKVALEDIDSESAPARRTTIWPTATTSLQVWAGAALVVLLLAVGYAAWRVWRPPQLTEPLKAVAITTFPGQEQYPSLSPDGTQVTFSWNGPKQDNFDIYVQMIGAGAPLQLTRDPARDYNPVWSPDGRWIAFLRGDSQSLHSELRLIPPLGGPERKLATITTGEIITLPVLLSWCPDSTCLVLSDSTGDSKPVALFALSLETGEKRQLTRPEPPAVGDSQPVVSPDGQSLIFRRNISGGLTGELHVLSLTRTLTPVGQPTRLTPPTLDANHPVWTTDSKEVVFSARERLWRVAVSGQQQPTRLPFVGEDGIMPAMSRINSGSAAKLVYVRSFADTNIWRIDTPRVGAPSLSVPAIAISSTRQDGNPQLSPDGRRVAFASNRSGDVEIWVADLDGSNAFQLTSMGAPATGTPRWSPDGTSVAFNSNLEGHWDVYVVAASGGKPRRLTADPSNDSAPSFSRDGRSIYFNSNRTGEFQIWKVPTAGGDAVQVTRNGGYIAFESPDGAYVYYTQTLAGPSGLWRMPSAGGEPLKVLDGVVWRNFVVLERGIYYIEQTSGDSRLRFFDSATGGVTTVATGLGEVRYGLTASSDGRTILFTRVDFTIDDLMLVENFR
jgi:serine/threonine protein kinase/Tol biopolymer transport system component